MGAAFKSLRNRLADSTVARGAVARLAAGYLRLCDATTRWRFDGADILARVGNEGGAAVAIWHGRLLFMPPHMKSVRVPVWAMISRNRDGAMIAAAAARFGVQAAFGSARNARTGEDKGGREALEALSAQLGAGAITAVTPDGPVGPRMRAKAGLAQLAIRHGAPIVLLTASGRRARLLRSWDRMMVPVPFDRGVVLIDQIPSPPPDADPAALSAQIEARLNALTARADAMAGRVPVEPAAIPDAGSAP